MKTDACGQMSRILIVNVNWIGDVLFSTPFIRAVRKAYPSSFIACVMPSRCRQVLELNPNIDEIILYDDRGTHRSFIAKLRFILALKAGRFDTAILLHRSFTRALMTYLAGIPRRIGYYTGKRVSLLTKAIEPPSEETHKVDYFLHIASELSIKDCGKQYEFFISESERAYTKELLRSGGIGDDDFLTVVNPGGNWLAKRWTKENFAELSDRLIEEFGAKVVISGAAKDRALAEEITSAMKKKGVVVLCGKTGLKQLAALLERADLLVSNDTGPTHIGAAMETPLVALFGPTSPRLTGPRGGGKISVIWKVEECRVPCYDLSCTYNRCMRLITVDEVMEAVRKLKIM